MGYRTTNDWDDLETFENVGARLGKPFFTISPMGTITLSSSFVHHARKQLQNQTHVRMAYSKKKNAIVLEFTDDPDESGAIKMGKRANISFAARSFFNYHGMSFKELSGQYSPSLEKIPKKGNCWVIYLQKKN